MNQKNQVSAIWLYVSILMFLLLCVSIGVFFNKPTVNDNLLTKNDIQSAAKVSGVLFTEKELALMENDVKETLKHYQTLRKHPLDNGVSPAFSFHPLAHLEEPVFTPRKDPADNDDKKEKKALVEYQLPEVEAPKNIEDLAFAPIPVLASLLKSRKITSVELTRMYIRRLKKYDPKLKCVITLTEDLALKQAKKADEEIAAGKYRGPLHGIPWGAKDLLATRGIKTTWGAAPFKDQIIDEDAAVVKKLEDAGAVLVAKLTLGALAWGDVWFGGTTKNPWDFEQGSSGSSAGPASATSAGLVGFSIGSETWGSIVSPSNQCGVTGLRPTFGRVSRAGAMALSWSMDKLGPICRSAEGCGLVLDAIKGADNIDLSTMDKPYTWTGKEDIKKLKIGYLKKAFEADSPAKKNNNAVLERFKEMGVELIAIDLPEVPLFAMSFILSAEAGAAFDEFSRSGRDDLMVRQIQQAWPNVIRQARLIPAIEYIQANRHRMLLMKKMADTMKKVDVFITPSFGGGNLLMTNLTGHPCVVVPDGFDDTNHPTSISFIGRLFGEQDILAVAKAFQDATSFHKKHPDLDK